MCRRRRYCRVRLRLLLSPSNPPKNYTLAQRPIILRKEGKGGTYIALAHTNRREPRVLQTIIKAIMSTTRENGVLGIDAVMFAQTHVEWDGCDLWITLAEHWGALDGPHEAHIRTFMRNLR